MVKKIEYLLYWPKKKPLSFIISILTSSILVFFLFSAGEAVEKGKLSITDTTGKPIDSVVIEIPSEDALKDKSIEVVKEDWEINVGYDYIIDAPGFKAAYLKGEDLNKKGGVQLEQTPLRFGTTPLVKSPIDVGIGPFEPIPIAEFFISTSGSMSTDLSNLCVKEGIDPDTVSIKTEPFFGAEGFRLSRKVFHEGKWKLPEEIEKDKGIESVAQHLQPINIFVGAGSESEPQTVKVGEIDTVLKYIDLEKAFEVYLSPKSEDLRKLSEALKKTFEKTIEAWQKYGFNVAPDWLDWVEDMEEMEKMEGFWDDPSVDAVDSLGFYISMPEKYFKSEFGRNIIFSDDPRRIQQKDNVIFIDQEDIF